MPKHEPTVPHFDSEHKINLPKGHYLKAIKNLDPEKYKDSFCFIFSAFHEKKKHLTTLTAYRVYDAIIEKVIFNGTSLKVNQKDLNVNIALSEISRAMRELKEAGLILKYTRGYIEVNPLYLWKGSLSSWQDKAMEVWFAQDYEQPDDAMEIIEAIPDVSGRNYKLD